MALELGFFAIPVRDMALAQKFYGSVMGWEFMPRDSAFSYIQSNGNMIGALEHATDAFDVSSQGPKLYFRADGMNAVLSRVEAAGGKVTVPSTAINGGERGYTAEIHDPSGNRLAFWAAKS